MQEVQPVSRQSGGVCARRANGLKAWNRAAGGHGSRCHPALAGVSSLALLLVHPLTACSVRGKSRGIEMNAVRSVEA